MRRITIIASLLAGLGLSTGSTAVTVVQCEDAEGNRTYQESCPPGTSVVEKKQIYTGPKQTGPDMEALKANKPVTLYRVETCEACDMVSDYLQERGVPFSLKNANDDVEVQKELREKTGELSVPVVTIGDDAVVTGYNKSGLKEKLDQAGYPDNTEQAAEQSSSSG